MVTLTSQLPCFVGVLSKKKQTLTASSNSKLQSMSMNVRSTNKSFDVLTIPWNNKSFSNFKPSQLRCLPQPPFGSRAIINCQAHLLANLNIPWMYSLILWNNFLIYIKKRIWISNIMIPILWMCRLIMAPNKEWEKGLVTMQELFFWGV